MEKRLVSPEIENIERIILAFWAAGSGRHAVNWLKGKSWIHLDFCDFALGTCKRMLGDGKFREQEQPESVRRQNAEF